MEALFTNINMYTLLALVLWSIPWKLWSLWLAARRGELWWFLGLSLVNTLGVLEIVYIFLIAKRSDKPKAVGSGQ